MKTIKKTLHFALCTLHKNTSLLLILCSLLLTTSCEKTFIPKNIHDSVAEPTISSFEPITGEPGTVITVKGTNLSTVNQALIGEQATQILYRYSNEEIVLKTTGNEASGKIKLVNHKGVAESSSDFTVLDIIPTVTNITPNPTEWVAYAEHTINGSNLNGVFEAKIGDYKVNITDKNAEKLVFNIPYFEATEALDLQLYYKQAGVTISIIAATGIPVNNPVIEPVINEFPTQAFPETQLILNGEYLDRITEVIYLDEDLTITSQKPTELKVLLPAIPTGQEYLEGALEIVHNGGIHTEIASNFVISTGTVLNFVAFKNITLAVNSPASDADMNNFFNASTGEIYTPCDYDNIKDYIDFFFSATSSGVQINNPMHSDGQLKNFRCNGVANSIPSGTRGQKCTRFYLLKDNNPVEAELKHRIKTNEPELTEITIAMIDTALGFAAEAMNPAGNTPRWKQHQVATENWDAGDVLVFRSYPTEIATTYDNTNKGEPGKLGFIEIVNVQANPSTLQDNNAKITINVWYQKQVE
ncbi:MAG: IPT/TIG domain-containing protein [Bacteroidales bacterium]|jgi:hypothetical protein|nr:IPT/TIG domain-containing protein [Bacteroidales bacterium]